MEGERGGDKFCPPLPLSLSAILGLVSIVQEARSPWPALLQLPISLTHSLLFSTFSQSISDLFLLPFTVFLYPKCPAPSPIPASCCVSGRWHLSYLLPTGGLLQYPPSQCPFLSTLLRKTLFFWSCHSNSPPETPNPFTSLLEGKWKCLKAR